MAEEWRRAMYAQAREGVECFVSANTDFTIDHEDPECFEERIDRGTNFVLSGQSGDRPVIYKWFAPDWGMRRYRNEMAALVHFDGTGYVPKVLAALPDQLIVMERLPGRFVDEKMLCQELDASGRDRLGRELGHAIALMVDTPVPDSAAGEALKLGHEIIPWNQDLAQAIGFYTGLCRRDCDRFPAAADPFYLESLDLVEQQLGHLARQRQIILHEDLHYFAHEGRVAGIFDVEMCRLGTEMMQLERLFLQCSPDGVPWESALAGYASSTGRAPIDQDYVFMMAMAAFYFHIRITRWGKPNAEKDWVQQYLPDIRGSVRNYEAYVDLERYLPHL
jgi:hypothetical protein